MRLLTLLLVLVGCGDDAPRRDAGFADAAVDAVDDGLNVDAGTRDAVEPEPDETSLDNSFPYSKDRAGVLHPYEDPTCAARGKT